MRDSCIAEGEGFLPCKRSAMTNLRVLIHLPHNASRSHLRDSCVAEGEGFEPPVPLSTTVFKTVVIDHSTIPPKMKGILILSQSLSLYALRGSNPGPID